MEGSSWSIAGIIQPRNSWTALLGKNVPYSKKKWAKAVERLEGVILNDLSLHWKNAALAGIRVPPGCGLFYTFTVQRRGSWERASFFRNLYRRTERGGNNRRRPFLSGRNHRERKLLCL